MMFAIIRVVFAMGLVLISSGCGQNTKTRATTGGVVGSGGGIALGVATGGIGLRSERWSEEASARQAARPHPNDRNRQSAETSLLLRKGSDSRS